MQQQAPELPTLDVTAFMAAAANAGELCLSKAAAADSGAEAKDFASAALQAAQVLTTLDPSRLAGGDTPQGRAASIPEQQATKDGDHDGTVGE